jgi:autotransporter-associated beta strand protein
MMTIHPFHRRRVRMFSWAAGVALLALGRQAYCVTETWDNGFDGIDSAADDVANYLRWDSAIDDDWDEPDDSFQLNTPSPGYMTVDRVANPADDDKTGNIWVRDPILNYADGFTMEVTVKIMPDSEANAFSMTYLDQGGSFGVQLSPDSIKVGGLAPTDPGTTVTYNTTNGFNTYWMEQLPNSHTVKLYVNGVLVDTGQGTSNYAVGSSDDLEDPRVLIGDNSNATNINADYVLESVYYRRGATSPTQTPSTFPARVLPSPPTSAPLNESWNGSYYGSSGSPSKSGWALAGGGTFTAQPDGSERVEYDTNAMMNNPAGWTDMTPITVEASLKVLPDSQPDGFELVVNDNLGDIALVLSPDKVTFEEAYSFVGQASITMNTTDAYHTYRITRDVDGLYWDLFIDNNPVAAIADQKTGGEEIGFSRIWFGDIDFPIPGNYPDVDVNYIRWHDGANSPTAPQLVNVTWNNSNAGGDGATWDQLVNQNWNNGSGAAYYIESNNVTFNDSNNGHYAVTLNTIVNPTSVTVNNSAGNYTFSGSGSIAGSGALTKSGTGTLTLSTANSYSGGTNVLGGLLIVGATGALPHASALTIGSASSTASVKLASGIGAVELSSLTLNAGSTLDLTNNSLLVDYTSSSPVASIRAALASGYGNGSENGTGIVSSTAAGNAGGGTTLGYVDTGTQVIIKYTWDGDANLDGVVNSADLSAISAAGTTWATGDFNYDGVVNADDYGLFALGAARSNGMNISSVPEPMNVAVLIGGMAFGFGRKRRDEPDPRAGAKQTRGN